jgi:hypothetical protein
MGLNLETPQQVSNHLIQSATTVQLVCWHQIIPIYPITVNKLKTGIPAKSSSTLLMHCSDSLETIPI